jgi:hypothetical protein
MASCTSPRTKRLREVQGLQSRASARVNIWGWEMGGRRGPWRQGCLSGRKDLRTYRQGLSTALGRVNLQRWQAWMLFSPSAFPKET